MSKVIPEDTVLVSADQKLDATVAGLQVLGDKVALLQNAVERIENHMHGNPNVVVPAYERPSITDEEANADGSVNVDGSIWLLIKAEHAPGSSALVPLAAPKKERQFFGYISPVKTPYVWEMARRLLGAEQFARWDAAWRRNPYGVYKTTPELVEATGAEVNTILFGYLTHATQTHVQ
jgi:hypothetical protein